MESAAQLGAEAGFGQIDEDYFLTTRLFFGMELPVPAAGCAPDEPVCLTRFRFGVQAPLRFRLIDRDPQQDDLLRAEDWDAPGDVLRVIRFLEYGHPHEPLHARLGELGATVVGHGTVMNGYYNVVTPDTYQFGVHANLNTLYGGAEFVLDNVADPDILGGRAYVRPWSFVDPESWLVRIAVGATALSDLEAPTRLLTDDSGVIAVDAREAPRVAEASHATVLGLDAEVSVLDGPFVTLMPYTDLNWLVNQGAGWHLGTRQGVFPAEGFGVDTRLELRWLGDGYLPDYFGPLYEIDRYQFSGWGQALPAPKLRIAASQRERSLWGAYGSATLQFFGFAYATAAYADYQGADNGQLWLRLDARPPGPLQLGVFYYKQNFDHLSEAFDLDGALAVGEARLAMWGPLYLQGSYSRMWRLHDDGRYETIDDWNVGAGAAFTF